MPVLSVGCGGERLSLTYDDSVATNSEYVVAGDHVGGVTSTFFLLVDSGKRDFWGEEATLWPGIASACTAA